MAWIKRVENAVGSAFMLYPKFPHMGEARPADTRGVRVRQGWPDIFQHIHYASDASLLWGCEFDFKPGAELVCELDLVGHGGTIPPAV